jgi:F-type H+-transporting ATPase subunit b
MEILGKLGIDYKILIAQIINFLVLLWILQYFLYKPLIKGLKARAGKIRKIEEGEKEIRRRKEEMKKKEEEIIKKAKDRTRQIIEEGKEVSEEEKERILRRAGEEMEKILREARIEADRQIEKARAKEKEEILKKSGKVLEEVLSLSFTKELHREYIKEMVKELKKLDFKKLEAKDVVLVKTIFAYPPERKTEKEISDFLFSKLKNPVFKTAIDPELIAGAKISIGGGFFLIDGSLRGRIKKIISYNESVE